MARVARYGRRATFENPAFRSLTCFQWKTLWIERCIDSNSGSATFSHVVENHNVA